MKTLEKIGLVAFWILISLFGACLASLAIWCLIDIWAEILMKISN